MSNDKPRPLTGRAWFAPRNAGPPNAAADDGTPISIDDTGVTRWTPLDQLGLGTHIQLTAEDEDQ